MTMKTRFALALTAVAAALSATTTALFVWVVPAAAQAPGASLVSGEAAGWGLAAAAAATGLSSLGAGIAVGKLGAAAVGALAEKPELFGRLLIFVGLAEGIAIYGLIISILILNRLG
jgi:V/A-type H+/Na+-transporting ATPase subunit K